MPRISGLRPAPVYVATLADGREARVSFWSAAGKPVNVIAGRRTVEAVWARPECSGKEAAASFFKTYPPAMIVAGRVEHPALAAAIVDTLAPEAAPKQKRRAAVTPAMLDALAAVLERGNVDEARTLLQRMRAA